MKKSIAVGAACLLVLGACGKKGDKETGSGAQTAVVSANSARQASRKSARSVGSGAQAAPARSGSSARPGQAARPAAPQEVWKENPKAVGGSGKAYHLALNMKPGVVYHAKMVTHQTIVQTIFGQKQVVEQIIGFGYDLKLLGRDKTGIMRVENRYTWVRFKQKLMGRTVDYDSSRGGPVPQNPMARVYAAINGASFRFHVTAEGHITKVDGMGALMQRVVNALPDGPNKPKLAEQIKKKFSDKMFRESLENMMAVYPDGPVRVGGHWSRVKEISLGMSLTTFTEYKLEKVTGKLAHLALTGKVRTPAGSSMDTFNPAVAMHYDIHGTQNGSNVLDVSDGMARSWNLKQSLSGKVTISKPGAKGQGVRSWPIVISSVIEGKVTTSRGH